MTEANETKRKIRDWGDVPKSKVEPEPSVEEVREFTADKKAAYVPGAMHRHTRLAGTCLNDCFLRTKMHVQTLQKAKSLTCRMSRSSPHWAPHRSSSKRRSRKKRRK